VIWCRLYRPGEVVLAMADEELAGKEFEEGDFRLSVGLFYQGELVDEERAKQLLKDATIINAVGKRAVGLLIEAGLIKERFVKTVQGVPHAQAVLRYL